MRERTPLANPFEKFTSEWSFIGALLALLVFVSLAACTTQPIRVESGDHTPRQEQQPAVNSKTR